MLKLLLVLVVAVLLLACGKTVLAKKKGDKVIWFDVHNDYLDNQPRWKDNEVEAFTIYFGKYYLSHYYKSGGNFYKDIFNEWYGDPYGPIVAIWRVARYPGERPSFEDCGKEPKYPEPPENILLSSPEFTEMKKKHRELRKKYYDCHARNDDMVEKSKSFTYYHARSTNKHVPEMPGRSENHMLYDIHISLGPIGAIRPQDLSEADRANKEQLQAMPCVNGDDCYRLAGKDSSLYYTARSIETNPPTKDGMASSPWKRPGLIRTAPHQWEEIEGIEISKAQYEYLQSRCDRYQEGFEGMIFCRLDDTVPNLTLSQQTYARATTWVMDNDEEALNAFVNKEHNYRSD